VNKSIALPVFALVLASAALFFPGHTLAQDKPFHVDIPGRKGGRLYGDITNAGDGFVFNGTLDVVVDSSHPEPRFKLFLYLYKNKEKIQTIYVPITGGNGHYVIENFRFAAESPFDHVGWRTHILSDSASPKKKSVHIDMSGAHGERIYGDITRADNDFVFNGIFDVAVNSSRSESRLQLFLYLYKDKKKVQTVYVPVKGGNGHYIIENLKFEAKSPFDAIVWKTQYNYRLD